MEPTPPSALPPPSNPFSVFYLRGHSSFSSKRRPCAKEEADGVCRDDDSVRAPAILAAVGWIALCAYARSAATSRGLPWPSAGSAACTLVLLFLMGEAATACACAEESHKLYAPLATPALLLSMHWTTSTVMRRAAGGGDASGIAEVAVPFALATIGGGALLLVEPSFGSMCRSAARRAIVHFAVGAWVTHAALSIGSS